MSSSFTLRAYYRAKPWIPRSVQISARRLRARRIWEELKRDPVRGFPTEPLNYQWPGGARCGVLLTHDIEHDAGQRNVEAVLEIEQSYDVTSCWNFVVRRYEVDRALIRRLNERGHEVGLHGAYHDGREFRSQAEFSKRLAIMQQAGAEWGAVGFRSPSMLYDLGMLRTVPFVWDSSMPAWDPFQPKHGDCDRFVPFHLSDRCVELPLTLWQDFVLFEELRMRDIEVWRRQVDVIHAVGGLINVIVHPDYMLTRERLDLYRGLLEHLQSKEGMWITTPSEVAEWERSRTRQPVRRS